MMFEEALKKLGPDVLYVMKRKFWDSASPYKYLWVTVIGCLVGSVGDGQSCPIHLSVDDFLADDWEVFLPTKQKKEK